MLGAKRPRSLISYGPQGRLPSLEANLFHKGEFNAAPYLRHIALAAPLLSDSPPDQLPGLLLPNITSVKPPPARRAPTRTNLFKGSASLSSSPGCGQCPLADRVVLVTHFGQTPPRTYLCTTATNKTWTSSNETLVPFATIDYQTEASNQFTLAANCAASTAIEITSFAAANPLNGQMTAAHVMDIDDITKYSNGSFELVATTPKDSVISATLARGLIGIMGPESYPSTLLQTRHPGAQSYPGWSFTVTQTGEPIQNNGAQFKFSDYTPHRWWVETTFEVNVHIVWKEVIPSTTLYIAAMGATGKCPPDPDKCPVDSDWPESQWGFACFPYTKDPATEKPVQTKCLSISGSWTTLPNTQLWGFSVDWETTPFPETESITWNVRSFCANPEAQFGPAFVGRFEGITKDIVVQINNRAAVAGVQSGPARAVAPPTTPSLTGLGDEDAVLAQALFDNNSIPIARVMTAHQYKATGPTAAGTARSTAVEALEAAPIGDTIRSIGSTVSKVGHSLGGPFSTIGDVIGTIGNIAGGIGDAIGSIFSAPATSQDGPVLMAAPSNRNISYTRAVQMTTSTEPRAATGPHLTPAEVRAQLHDRRGWSVVMNDMVMARGFNMRDTMQAFPWVNSTDQTSGIANIFLTSNPLTLPDRPTTRYYSVSHLNNQTQTTSIIYIDERLVTRNEARYYYELAYLCAYFGFANVYISTDAQQFVFGDSMSAALLAAIIFPSQLTAVSGSVEPGPANYIRLAPVGLLNSKAQATLDAGLILVCPPEQASLDLRDTTEGTSVVSTADIMLGLLSETPKVIITPDIIALAYAQFFAESTKSTPIGPEETAAKQAQVEESVRKGQQQQQARSLWIPPPDATPEEVRILRTTPVTFDVPGLGQQSVPLFDIEWWTQRRHILEQPASEKGIGSSLTKISQLIEAGNVNRLRGLAMSVISREEAATRRRRRPTQQQQPQSRIPPYKRPQTGQISNLMERIRQAQLRQQQPPPPPVSPVEEGFASADEDMSAPYLAEAKPNKKRARM